MKNNKKLIVILIVLVIGLVFCASLIIYNHSIKNNQKNVIDIDDCSGKDCNKKKDDNKKTDDKGNDSKNNNSNNNNINPSSGSGGNGTGTGDGSGNSSGNGSSSGSSSSGDGQGSESGSGSGSGSGSASGSSSGSASGTTPGDEPAKDIVVSDKNTTWNQNTSLKIFNVNSIAPGDNGSYEFAINNNTGENVAYSISFSEDNQYNVNLLYKLKMNGNYIAGDSDTWLSSNELNLNNKVLDSDYMDSFYLEWKWVDSDHDTIAGITPGAKYTLHVNVSTKETTDHDTSGSGSINPHTGDKIILYIEICLGSAIAVLLLILLKRKKNESIEHN